MSWLDLHFKIITKLVLQWLNSFIQDDIIIIEFGIPNCVAAKKKDSDTTSSEEKADASSEKNTSKKDIKWWETLLLIKDFLFLKTNLVFFIYLKSEIIYAKHIFSWQNLLCHRM